MNPKSSLRALGRGRGNPVKKTLASTSLSFEDHRKEWIAVLPSGAHNDGANEAISHHNTEKSGAPMRSPF